MDIRRLAPRLLLAAALGVFILGGLSRISFNVDILKLLPARLGTVTGLSLFARHFSQPRELLVTVEAPDSETAARAVSALAESFRAAPDLVQRVVTESPWESHPQELSEFVAYLLVNQPTDEFAQMLARISPEKIDATLQETKETLADSFTASEIGMASYDPLGLLRSLDLSRFATASNLSEFSSQDGTFRVVYVDAAQSMSNYRVAIAWMKSLRARVAAAKLPPEIKIGFTGEPAYVAEISSQMQWDMASSGFITTIIISIIFWSCFRRLIPLAHLIGMLGTTFVLTLSLAGWVLNELSMIGVGFASIMIGLSVDYGYMIYQTSLTEPNRAVLRRRVFPYVVWAATTTSAAFFTLNASSMPGLNHLGNLVAMGVLVGGVVMMSVFIPLVSRRKTGTPEMPRLEKWLAQTATRRGGLFFALSLVAVLLGTLSVRGLPAFDSSVRTLKMRHSDADNALEHLYAKLTDEHNLMSFIAIGSNESELLAHLRALDQKLETAAQNGSLRRVLSPTLLCPDAAAQRANLAAANGIFRARDRLAAAVSKAGFRDDAFVLSKSILDKWQMWERAGTFPIWPRNETSAWILRRMVGRDPQGLVAMALIEPAPDAEEKLIEFQDKNIYFVSWPLLGRELRRVIPREFAIIIVSLLAGLYLLLIIAFRSARDVLLMTFTMILVFLSMMGAMRLLGMNWNVFNIAAVMLLLGTGTDYSIYVILALNRNGGDAALTQRTTGLVVFLCAGSAVAGFGSLAWAGHLGLASLGQVCALGLALDAIITVFLLPPMWRRWTDFQEKKKAV